MPARQTQTLLSSIRAASVTVSRQRQLAVIRMRKAIHTRFRADSVSSATGP